MKGGNAAKYEVIRHFIFHINSVVKVAKKMFTKIVTKKKQNLRIAKYLCAFQIIIACLYQYLAEIFMII